MEIRFRQLKKKMRAVADGFTAELKLLPIFLNYYGTVRDKWLKKIKLSNRDISIVDRVVDIYALKKISMENRLLPRTRKQVITIENRILKNTYEGRLLSSTDINPKLITAFIKEEFPDSAVLGPKQLNEIELLTLLKIHKKSFPVNFLVFDEETGKIIGYEVVKINKEGENDGSIKRKTRKINK